MAKALIAIILVLFAKNGLGTTTCGINRQIYDVKGNISLNLGAESEDKMEVRLYAQVTLERLDNYTQLQVMELSMTDYKENVHPNPIGIEKPIMIGVQDSGGYNLKSDPGDSVSSIAIKRHIISLLPRQALAKAADNPNLTKIKATQDLLKRGENELILKDNYKDLIVVLGNTGAGKSTLTQWLAGDSSRLEAKEVIEGSGEYIIEDNLNRIGNSTIDSKTTFPELIIDKKHNEAYYDFPGFSDTRDSSYDIATSYFIKTTLDHAKAIKMLFVVSYPSLRKGVDRQDFLKLLRHISELIKDVNKFHGSLALVVTKVDNQMVWKQGQPSLVDDTKIIEGIAKFLEEAKNDLQHRFSTANPSSKDLKFYKSSIRFIDLILEQKENKYSRIGLFRRPLEAGSLNKMPILQKEKEIISNIMDKTLKYTEKMTEDFGRTVSDRSKNDINDLIQEIDKNILFSTCSIAEMLQTYFKDLQMQLSSNINKTNTSEIAIADIQLKEIRKSFENFKNTFNIIEELTSTIKNFKNDEDTSQVIFERVSRIELPSLGEYTKEILNQGRYLKFLQSMSDTKSYSRLSPLAWASSFQNILTEQSVTLSRTQNHMNNIESEISKTVYNEITKIGKDFLDLVSKDEETFIDLHEVLDKLRRSYNKMAHLVYIDNIADYIDNIMKITTSFKIYTSDGVKMYLTRDSRYFDHLHRVINEVIEYLHDSQFWYKFLNHLHEQLLTYKVQKERNIYYELIKKNIKSSDEKRVSEIGIEVVLQEIFDKQYKPIYDTVKNITLDKNKMKNFLEVVSVTLERPKQSCNGEKMIIEGTVIKTSEILQMVCPNEVSLIEIFATSKIFIDADLKEENKDLTIIAPTWEIQGKKDIILIGKTGSPHKESKAQNGQYSSENGINGKPGLPGHRGGNFLGIGKTFLNSEQLSVYSIGGTGGPGQNGGDGARGADGDNPYIGDPEKYLKSIGWFNDESKYTCSFFCLYSEYDKYTLGGCTNGGKPGLGGAGGFGGNPGKVHIISTIDDRFNITTVTHSGNEGNAGLPGREGRAGRPGKYLKFDWAFFRSFYHRGQTDYTVEDSKNCNDGEEIPHSYIVNFNNQILPSSFSIFDEVNIVHEYKDYLHRIYNDTVTASEIKYFLEELENTPGIPDGSVPDTSVSDEAITYDYSSEKEERENTKSEIQSSTTIDVNSVISRDENTTISNKYNSVENDYTIDKRNYDNLDYKMK